MSKKRQCNMGMEGSVLEIKINRHTMVEVPLLTQASAGEIIQRGSSVRWNLVLNSHVQTPFNKKKLKGIVVKGHHGDFLWRKILLC